MAKILHHLHRRKKSSVYDEARPPPRASNRLRGISAVGALLFALYFVVPYLFRPPADPVVNGQRVTECDRLAAHPSDTLKVATGVTQDAVDIPKARAACEQAIREMPGNGRILYQLGRTFFYNDEKVRGIEIFRQSADAGYPQGQFVLGLILMQGNGIEPNPCEAGRLWLAAARQRHLYSKIFLGQNWLDGGFSDCDIGTTKQELDGLISAAEELADSEQQRDDVAMLKKNWAQGAR